MGRQMSYRVRHGLRYLGPLLASIQVASQEAICEQLAKATDTHRAVFMVNHVLELCRPQLRLTMQMVRQHSNQDGIEITGREQAWMDSNPGSSEWYIKLKRELIEAHFGNKRRAQRTLSGFGNTTMALVRTLGIKCTEDLSTVTAGGLRSAMVRCLVPIMTSPQSLAGLRHGSRKKKAAVKTYLSGYAAARAYCVSANFLGRHLRLPSFLNFDPADVLTEAAELLSNDVNVELRNVEDVLSVEEMERAVSAAQNVKEKLIVLLLSRLGMRIGAIEHLRLSGVLEGDTWDALHRGEQLVGPWPIRRYIQGNDKGHRINTWDTMFIPEVHVTLHDYVNNHWRPNFERWKTDNKGNNTLANSWLFPSMTKYKQHERREKNLAGRCIGPILKRAGITGPNAHCHAFRKGVITALKRAGNTIDDISVFVHHTNSQTTQESYVFIPYSEVVQRMRVPDAWQDNKDDDVMTEELASTANQMASMAQNSASESGPVSETMAIMEQCGAHVVELAQKIDQLRDRERRLIQVLQRMLPSEHLSAISAAWQATLEDPDECETPSAPPPAQ